MACLNKKVTLRVASERKAEEKSTIAYNYFKLNNFINEKMFIVIKFDYIN